MINLSIPRQDNLLHPKILVLGVGGAGCNAVNYMCRCGLSGVDFMVTNTDAQALEQSPCTRKLQLGHHSTEGLGAGADPQVGAQAAHESLDELFAEIEDYHMIFLTAGMGGGTGTGAAPILAEAFRDRRGILTVGVVTKPFNFEGPGRMAVAQAGIAKLAKGTDSLLVIPNQNLFLVTSEKTALGDAFKLPDQVLEAGVRSMTDLIVRPGLINLDFSDIRTVMKSMGRAVFGTGETEGDNRAEAAADMAINNPLLDGCSINGARGALVNITGGSDLTLFEVEKAVDRLRGEMSPEAKIIFGATVDEDMLGRLRVSIIATGVDAHNDEELILEPESEAFSPQPQAQSPQFRPDITAPSAYGSHPHSHAAASPPARRNAQKKPGLRQVSAPYATKAYPHRSPASSLAMPPVTPRAHPRHVAAAAPRDPKMEPDRREKKRSFSRFLRLRPNTSIAKDSARRVETQSSGDVIHSNSLDVLDALGRQDILQRKIDNLLQPQTPSSQARAPHRPERHTAPGGPLAEASFVEDDNIEVPAFLRRKAN